MTTSILGNIFPTQLDLMNHLSEYGMLTNKQIVKRCSNEYGTNAEQVLSLMLERDFCKSAINNIKVELKKLVSQKDDGNFKRKR